jgi:hypothetical protein
VTRRVDRPASAPAAAPGSADKAAKGDAAKKTGPKTAADIEQDFRKRQQDQAKAEKESAEKSAEAQRKQDNCRSARERLANYEIGGRVTRINPQGERYYLEDAQIEQLQWPRRRLWLSLRIAMPQAAGRSRFDQRADIAQAGAIALAVLLGRPLRDEEFPDGLHFSLREASDRVARANPTLALGFAGWLLKALQIEGRSFGSAKEALVALDDLLAPAPKPVSPPRAESAARRPVIQPLADSR